MINARPRGRPTSDVVHTVKKSPDAPLSVPSCVCHGDCSYVPSAHTHWAETLYRVKRLWGGLCSIDRLSVAPNRHRITPQCTHAPANCDKHRSLLGLVVDGCALSRHSRARAFIRTASRPAPPTGTRCLGPRQPRLPLPPPAISVASRAKRPDRRRPGVSRRPPMSTMPRRCGLRGVRRWCERGGGGGRGRRHRGPPPSGTRPLRCGGPAPPTVATGSEWLGDPRHFSGGALRNREAAQPGGRTAHQGLHQKKPTQ